MFRKKTKNRMICSFPLIEHYERQEVIHDDGHVTVESVKVADNRIESIQSVEPFNAVTLEDMLNAGVQVKQVSTKILNPSRIDSLQNVAEQIGSDYLDSAVNNEIIEKVDE